MIVLERSSVRLQDERVSHSLGHTVAVVGSLTSPHHGAPVARLYGKQRARPDLAVTVTFCSVNCG